jgi:hypothetical protein
MPPKVDVLIKEWKIRQLIQIWSIWFTVSPLEGPPSDLVYTSVLKKNASEEDMVSGTEIHKPSSIVVRSTLVRFPTNDDITSVSV